jgi:hypothetical protein
MQSLLYQPTATTRNIYQMCSYHIHKLTALFVRKPTLKFVEHTFRSGPMIHKYQNTERYFYIAIKPLLFKLQFYSLSMFITHRKHQKRILYTLQNKINALWRAKGQKGLHVMNIYYTRVVYYNNMAFYTNEVRVTLFIDSSTCTDNTAMLSDKNIRYDD